MDRLIPQLVGQRPRAYPTAGQQEVVGARAAGATIFLALADNCSDRHPVMLVWAPIEAQDAPLMDDAVDTHDFAVPVPQSSRTNTAGRPGVTLRRASDNGALARAFATFEYERTSCQALDCT